MAETSPATPPSTAGGHTEIVFGAGQPDSAAFVPPPVALEPTARQPRPQPARPNQEGGDSAAEQKSPPDQDKAKEEAGANPDDEKQKQPIKPFYKRPLLMTVLVAGIAAIGIGVLVWWLHARNYESTDDAFIDGYIVRVAPSKVSGYVVKLLVRDNELVHEGDLLLEIDRRDYQVAVDLAKAAETAAADKLTEAGAQAAAASADAKAALADVEAAHATARNALRDMERNRALAPHGAVSMQTLDNSVASASSTTAQERAAAERAASAEAQYKLALAQRETAAAQWEQAREQVRQAEINLSYTRIHAPITGHVTQRTVDIGNYVQPGQPLFALVDPNVWVTANYKETQLDLMRAGQPVSVRVDAFPEYTLRAHVDSFQRGSGARFSLLPPENATGNYVKVVQRVPVKIVFDQQLPKNMVFGPGMSVEPTVQVRQP